MNMTEYTTSEQTRNRMRESAAQRMRPVIQLTKRLEYVREHRSIAEAVESTGISKSSIMNCLSRKNRSHSAGGFIWGYKSEFTEEGLARLVKRIPTSQPV